MRRVRHRPLAFSNSEVIPDPEWHRYAFTHTHSCSRPFAGEEIIQLPRPIRSKSLYRRYSPVIWTWAGHEFQLLPDKKAPLGSYICQYNIQIDWSNVGILRKVTEDGVVWFVVQLHGRTYVIKPSGPRTALYEEGCAEPVIIVRSTWKDSESAKGHFAYLFCAEPATTEHAAALCWMSLMRHFYHHPDDPDL